MSTLQMRLTSHKGRVERYVCLICGEHLREAEVKQAVVTKGYRINDVTFVYECGLCQLAWVKSILGARDIKKKNSICNMPEQIYEINNSAPLTCTYH